MSDQPTQSPPAQTKEGRVYGFAPRKPHFIWRKPEEIEPFTVPEPESGKISLAEALDAVRELSTTAPSVAKEMLRILTDEKQPPQQSEPSTAIVVAPIGVTSAPVTVEVTPAPANSRSSNSLARRKSRSRRKKKAAPPPSRRLSRLELHQAHCCICGADDQEEIEEAFINWDCVNLIAHDYDIDRRALYRHAHATGLFAKRDLNIRRALGRIIHQADRVTVTADSVIGAVKILTHVNAHGDWVQPPTHVIFSTAAARPASSSRALPADKRSDTPCKVFSSVSHSKQTKGTATK